MMCFDHSVDIPKFKVYIETLRALYFFDNLCLWFDGLAVHRSNLIRERLDELGIAYIYNPGYSPQYSGVEGVFNIYKNKLKRLRL